MRCLGTHMLIDEASRTLWCPPVPLARVFGKLTLSIVVCGRPCSATCGMKCLAKAHLAKVALVAVVS